MCELAAAIRKQHRNPIDNRVASRASGADNALRLQLQAPATYGANDPAEVFRLDGACAHTSILVVRAAETSNSDAIP